MLRRSSHGTVAVRRSSLVSVDVNSTPLPPSRQRTSLASQRSVSSLGSIDEDSTPLPNRRRSSLDQRMEAALNRNLSSCALRVTCGAIRAEMRGTVRAALRRLKSYAAEQHMEMELLEKAEACAWQLGCSRGLLHLKSSSSAWQLTYARARRHHHLTALMKGFLRLKALLAAVVRKLREDRKRRQQQYHALLQLQARILLVRWRQEHGILRGTIRVSRQSLVTRRRLTCRSALARWRIGVSHRTDCAALSQHALVLCESFAASRALLRWRGQAGYNCALEHASSRADRRGRRKRCAACWSAWRLYATSCRSHACSDERATRRRDAKARAKTRVSFGAWRRHTSRRVRACALARRALHRWALRSGASHRHVRTRELLESFLLVAYPVRRLRQWRRNALRVANAASLDHSAHRHRRARLNQQKVRSLHVWQGEVLRRRAVREHHALCTRRFARFGARKWLLLWRASNAHLALAYATVVRLQRTADARRVRRDLEIWMEERSRRAASGRLLKRGRLWATHRGLSRWCNASHARRAAAAEMRGRAHAAALWLALRTMRLWLRHWLCVAKPLAAAARWVEELRVRLLWRSACSSLGAWRRAAARGVKATRDTRSAHDLFVCRSFEGALDALERHAVRRRRSTALRGALSALFRRPALQAWSIWAEATLARSVDIEGKFADARRSVSARRRAATFEAWVVRYAVEHAVASRLCKSADPRLPPPPAPAALFAPCTPYISVRHPLSLVRPWRLSKP